jgi:RND family efflux transporter MFP subunit
MMAAAVFGLAATLATCPADAQQAVGAPPVTVSEPLTQQVVDWQEETGQFAPVEYVEVRARVSGYLTEIHFADGQMVKRGDLLFVIDPRPYEIAVAAARAGVDQANASLELAKRQLARGGELRQKDFLAQSDYDTRLQQTKVAEAALDTARAQLRDAELNLEFTRITSPTTGRIGMHQVSLGNLISGGGSNGATAPTLLATVVSLDPIYFDFDMSEADYLTLQRAVAAGQIPSTREGRIKVQVRLMDEKQWAREGRLDFLDNQIDRSAGTIRVRAVLANPDLFITPGQFGRVRLAGTAPYQALMIPEQAVLTDQSRKIVMTVAGDGTVMAKPIVPGPVVDGLEVVRSGIEPTDKVVIDGLMRARPGSKVSPQQGTIPPLSRAD